MQNPNEDSSAVAHMKSQKLFFDMEHAKGTYAKYALENWRISYLRRVFKALDLKSDDLFLDIGCGGLGYVVVEVARRKNCYSIGVDISPMGAKQASSFAKKELSAQRNFEFIVCSATHLPFADHLFSKITLIAVLEHIPDEQSVISEISRICRDKGKVLISVPNSYQRTLPLLTLAKIRVDNTVGHLRSYKAENLLKNLIPLRFTLQSLSYHAHFVKGVQSVLQYFPPNAGNRLWWLIEDLDDYMNKISIGFDFTMVLEKQ